MNRFKLRCEDGLFSHFSLMVLAEKLEDDSIEEFVIGELAMCRDACEEMVDELLRKQCDCNPPWPHYYRVKDLGDGYVAYCISHPAGGSAAGARN